MALQVFPEISKITTLSNGTTYAYINVPPKDDTKATFLLLHGFPSSSYDWRHVVSNLKENGFGVIAPDLLGYGDSDKPTEISAYSFKKMADETAELVRHEHSGKVVAVGHDWGSGLLSTATIVHPDLFSGIVFISAGYFFPPNLDAIDVLNMISQQTLGYPIFGYWRFHNEDDAAAAYNSNPASAASIIYNYPEEMKTHYCPVNAVKSWIKNGKMSALPSWLTQDEFDTREKIFKTGGYSGPLNWYKSSMRGVDEPFYSTLTDESKTINIPALIITGELDPICVPEFEKPRVQQYLRNHRFEQFKCGHWIPLEKPAELSSEIVKFVQGL